MRNNFFNILLIIAFTAILTKNEVYTSSAIEYVKYTKEHEKEAKKDMQSLVLSLGNDDFSEKYQDYTQLISGDTTKSDKIMHRIDKNLEKKYFSSDAQTTENIKRGEHMQNSALNLKSPINSRSNQHNFYADDQFIQLMKTLAIPKSFMKSRTGGNHNVNNSLRNGVNFVNVKPEVYPIFITEDEYGSKKIYNKDSVEISDQIHANNENKLIQLPNILDTEHKKLSSIRTANMPVTETLDLNELLKQLHINKGEVIVTKKEPKDNVQLNDFLNKFYSQSVNRMKFGNTKVNAHINIDELEDNIGSKDRDKSKTILLRNEVIDNEQLNANKRLEEIMEYLGFGKSLRTSYNTLYDADNPIRQGETSGRRKRSTNTQAGYTQDPDTCKTYNENLVILWSKLSKLINVTEQPNERALHNIALIIQAYLEHQNAKQPPETHRTKHEGLREIINVVMLKIRKLIGKNDGSAEKITKVIIKYLKPDYTNAETEDCQQVNEEFLFSSVDLLYKNYLENTDCEDEDDNVARSKTLTLMDREAEPGKFNFGHTSLPLSTGDINPEIQTIVIENETYNDFQRRKVSRQRLTNEHRTVVKPNKNKKPRHGHRSENLNGIEKPQTLSKSSSKSVNKKQKKSSLKSDGVKSKCEKYLTRKLIISLRPVMERFMERLECQHDNTLRSIRFGEYSNPYYVYATKFYSNTPMLLTRNSGRQRNKSYKLRTDRHESPIKHDQNVYKRDDENDYMWDRKYSFDQNRGMNVGKHAIHDTNLRELYTIKNTQQNGSSDYQKTYNKYYQSPLLYNAYDGINKRHQVTNSNGFTSLINPAFSINDKKVLGSRSTNQKLASSDIEQDEEKDQNEEKDFFLEELNDAYNFDRKTETETDTIEIPFIDLTQLRNDDKLIEEKNNGHLKTFESIAEFLKMARDASVKTPEFALPFALDTNKGKLYGRWLLLKTRSTK